MNIETFINELGQFTSTPENGVTRLPFTKESALAFDYIVNAMNQLGLKVYTDKYGTIQGHLAGKKTESVMIASHYDSVVGGGKYDGVVGIATGLAAINHLVKHNIIPDYSIDILALNDEEGLRFNQGFLSSKTIVGELKEANIYDISTHETLYDLCKKKMYGTDTISLSTSLKNVANYIEVHIEQGMVLEEKGCDIGIVDKIVGIKRFYVTVCGNTGHAGTTPMSYRNDALVTACKIINELQCIPAKHENMVLTVGMINVHPNAVNVIPGRVTFSIDVRSPYKDDLELAHNEIDTICERFQTTDHNDILIATGTSQEPCQLNDMQNQKLESIIKKYSTKYYHMNSGAGHDAQIFAPYIPTSMLFVPSYRGYSHRPDEYTGTNYIDQVTQILCDYVTKSYS